MDQIPLRILIVENTPKRQKAFRELFRDHAWILVNTAKRALRMIRVFDFDLILLDYDLDGEETGEKVASFIPESRNATARIWVHSMNVQGAKRIREFLPDAVAIPFTQIIRDNRTFKKLRQSINEGIDIDWAYVFRRSDKARQ